MRLFYRPRTGRPVRVAWLLEELGEPYEAVAVSSEEAAADAHRALHPLGRVPAVAFDDGTTLFDSTAIVLQLADLHPDAGLIGPLGSAQRGQAYAWALTAMTEGERAAVKRLNDREDEMARERFGAVADAIAGGLDGHDFLVADRFGVADIVTGGVLLVAELAGLHPAASPPVVVDYLARLRARPAFGRAAERVESTFRP